MVGVTALLLERRFLADYARTGTNLLLLLLVPVTFVLVAAPTLADAAEVLGGATGGASMETATAGWAAGFLTGIAMYFQVASSRATDRRLVLAGLAPGRLAAARLLTGGVLAAGATAAALVPLAARQSLSQPVRVVVGTAMFAVVYLAIGALIGALVPTPVNGSVLLLFVWILDVFFGPALSGSASPLLRVLPTHFISLWTIDQPPGHAGPGTLTWSALWLVAALAAAHVVVGATPGRARGPASRRAGQLRTGLRMGVRDWGRTPLLWLLLAAVPAVFILLSAAITPHGISRVVVREDGVETTTLLDPAVIHPGTMAPEAIASLAGLVGVFIVLDARAGDRRLVLAGQRAIVAVLTRMLLVLLAAAVVTAASLGVTATVFTAAQWGIYAWGSVLIAVTYGLIGMLLGPIFGRVSGVFMAFLVPFIDLGLGQSPMLGGEPPVWARWLPGYSGMRVLIDGGLTSGFDEGAQLAVGLLWVGALAVLVAVLLRRGVGGRPSPRTTGESYAAGLRPGRNVA